MVNLNTNYLGLTLRNPIIVSSSGLVDNIDKVQKLYDNGAGAVVLKSLFEEQINQEAGRMISDYSYPEASDYIKNYTKNHSVDQYLDLIEKSKKKTDIPVIASINCISSTDWIGFASQIEEAGADALELNMFVLPVDGDEPQRIEQAYFDTIKAVKKVTNLPLVLKVSPFFSNILYMINQFYALGVKGVVMFNRLYEPDININEMKMVSAEVFSYPADLRNTLRWISLAANKEKEIHLSASTGVHSGDAVVKLLLAGAQTVQVCSALYKNGIEYLTTLVNELTEWMAENDYESVEDIRGLMSYRSFENPRTWERTQFMKYFASRD